MDRSGVICLYCGANRDSSCPVEWFTLGFAFQWGKDWVDTGSIFLHGEDSVRLKFDREDLKVNFKKWQKKLLAEEERDRRREERIIRELGDTMLDLSEGLDGEEVSMENGRRVVRIN